MVITVMDMTLNNKYCLRALLLFGVSNLSYAGDWQVQPSVSLNETYSDNVELTRLNQQSSYVTQVTAQVDTEFTARLAELNLNATSTYASYSHNHDLDDSYRTLATDGRLYLWADGLALTGNATIRNQTRNAANNSLADLVSADTVEVRNFQTGLAYNIDNLNYALDASVNFSRQSSEDNIGDNNQAETLISSRSKASLNDIFWRFDARYTDQENDLVTGRNHIIDAIAGVKTPYKINPFVRIYNEKFSGNISRPEQTSGDAIGIGFNALLSSHLILNTSYNFASDEDSDNYVAATIQWEPSARTSVTARYNRRFFGDSYNLNVAHRTKRLTNSIVYDETLRAFDRNSFRRVLVGNFLCPQSFDPVNSSFAECFQQQGEAIAPQNTRIVQLFEQQLVEGSEFSLNKELRWQSQLNLARTTFSLNVNHNRRESLTTNVRDNRFDTVFAINRKISGKSSATISYNFNHTQLDKDQVLSLGQDDYYRTVSLSYNRKLARTLNSVMSLQMVDRNSSDQLRTYEETRAIITLTKDF